MTELRIPRVFAQREDFRYGMVPTLPHRLPGLHPVPPPRRGDGAEEGTHTRGRIGDHGRRGFKHSPACQPHRCLQVPSFVPLLARRRDKVEADSCRLGLRIFHPR